MIAVVMRESYHSVSGLCECCNALADQAEKEIPVGGVRRGDEGAEAVLAHPDIAFGHVQQEGDGGGLEAGDLVAQETDVLLPQLRKLRAQAADDIVQVAVQPLLEILAAGVGDLLQDGVELLRVVAARPRLEFPDPVG